jgi:hypothetical protein
MKDEVDASDAALPPLRVLGERAGERGPPSSFPCHPIPHRKNAAEWVMYAMVWPILWGMRVKRRVGRL